MSCESSGSWRKRIKTQYKDGRLLFKIMSRKRCDPESRRACDLGWLRLKIQERKYEHQERLFMAKEDVRYYERKNEKNERLLMMEEDVRLQLLIREEIEWEKRINEALVTCGKELDEKLALMKKPKSKKRPRCT